MNRMDTEENNVTEEEAEETPVYDIALVLGAIDDERRAQLQEQLDAAGDRLREVTATLVERSGRDSWKTRGVRVEIYDSGQSLIKGNVVDPEEELEFNVELRPSNFFDDTRPWRPGEPPRPMNTSAWDVEGEALVMKVTKVSGRKYPIQETAAELEETRHDSPEDGRRGVRQVRRRHGRARALTRSGRGVVAVGRRGDRHPAGGRHARGRHGRRRLRRLTARAPRRGRRGRRAPPPVAAQSPRLQAGVRRDQSAEEDAAHAEVAAATEHRARRLALERRLGRRCPRR